MVCSGPGHPPFSPCGEVFASIDLNLFWCCILYNCQGFKLVLTDMAPMCVIISVFQHYFNGFREMSYKGGWEWYRWVIEPKWMISPQSVCFLGPVTKEPLKSLFSEKNESITPQFWYEIPARPALWSTMQIVFCVFVCIDWSHLSLSLFRYIWVSSAPLTGTWSRIAIFFRCVFLVPCFSSMLFYPAEAVNSHLCFVFHKDLSSPPFPSPHDPIPNCVVPERGMLAK